MAVVATGFFDGVHLGHRLVIDTLLRAARERGEQSVVVTFWPHPRTVLQKDARELRLLSSLAEKRAMLSALGVDRVEVVPFSREFSRLTAEEYLREWVVGRLGGTAVVLGYDNRMGSDGLAHDAITPLAKSLGLDVIECDAIFSSGGGVPPQKTSFGPPPSNKLGSPPLTMPRVARFSEEAPSSTESVIQDITPLKGFPRHSERSEESISSGKAISSTKIRAALERGEVAEAEAMLGYRYGLHGVVVAGNRLGRTIGYPTANMQLYEPLKLVPANGVYLVEVETLGRHCYGMANIGVRPTVSGAGARTIETHIFDFDELIYGLDIRLRFVAKIRDERRFESLEALKEQLAADEALCRGMLAK
ncbi:MAG: bifunctional riboflavin kinase/FMN adenylyltransferase [Bacteroidales bacterium]|nr:bifunctional riboflavin kinase/FMN adenylyltransferase [Bacteroidales bacterium]